MMKVLINHKSLFQSFLIFLFVGLTSLLHAQNAELATVLAAEPRQVPVLTGNAAQDEEIQRVRANDLARFEMHSLRMQDAFGGKLNTAQQAYLKTVGVPGLVYTGSADGDFETFKTAFRVWKQANQAQIPSILQHLADLK